MLCKVTYRGLGCSMFVRGKDRILSIVVSHILPDKTKKQIWRSTQLCYDTTPEEQMNKKIKELLKDIYKDINSPEYKIASIKKIDPDNSEPDGLTLSELAEKWLQYKKNTVVGTTLQGYIAKNRQLLNYFGEDTLIKNIDAQSVIRFYDIRSDINSSATVKKLYIQLNDMFNYAEQRGYISKNTIPKYKINRNDKSEPVYYSTEELKQLMEVFKGDRMEIVVLLAINYGLRRSEICGLRWRQVDFKNNTITINHIMTNSFGDGEHCKGEERTKSKHSKRTLPMTDTIKECLVKLLEDEEKNRTICGDSWDTEFEGYVCRDEMGKLISLDFITNHFRYMVKKHGLRKLRFHDLRHTNASLLIQQNINMKVLQGWLGHQSFAVTADLYSHLYSDAFNPAANSINDTLSDIF